MAAASGGWRERRYPTITTAAVGGGLGAGRIRGLRLFSGGGATTAAGGAAVESLKGAIAAKGEEIRGLKSSGADKAALQPLIDELLALKAREKLDSTDPWVGLNGRSS